MRQQHLRYTPTLTIRIILPGSLLLNLFIARAQWQPGQTYDLHQETYQTKVLWQTDQANYAQRINEYRGYHHILASYRSNTYIVYIDHNWRPRIVKVRSDGSSEEAFLDEEDYHILENDSHQFFALGVDEEGYIHVFGDMHNFPERNSDHLPARYSAAKCMYWRSDDPQNISNFTWYGGQFGDSPWGTSFTYPQIFYDQDGKLYFSTRVRSATGERYAAVNYNRYNTSTKQWELLGGVNEFGNQCLFYEDNGEGGGTYSKPCRNLNFDIYNTAHFVSSLFNSNREKPFPEKKSHYNTDLVYAASEDGGDSFRCADGTSISTLPMRIDEADQRPDVIMSNTLVRATKSEAVPDYRGIPHVIGDEYYENGDFRYFCFKWDSTNQSWEDISGLRPQAGGYFVSDRMGVNTFVEKSSSKLHRFFEFGQASVIDPGLYDICIDRRHLLETGNIRGIPRRMSDDTPFKLVEIEIDRPVQYPAMWLDLSDKASLRSGAPESVLLYPNPASDHVNVMTERSIQGIVEITDGRGMTLKRQPIDNNHLTIFMEGIDPGIYYLRIVSEAGTYQAKRFVVLGP